MAYHAYDVWGDFETVRGASKQTWAAHEETQAWPTSLAKPRTSLFGAERYMRMTDFDEDIAGIEGSEAAWIERCVNRSPKHASAACQLVGERIVPAWRSRATS